MIGIATSLPIEASCLTTKRLRVGQTVLLTNNVLLHISGMGAKHAEVGARSLIAQGADTLISWGTAGGLSQALTAGRLIIPEKIIDQQSNFFLTDQRLRQHFQQILQNQFTICNESLLQTHKVITSVDAKHALFKQYQTVAVDMESAAVAAVAKTSSVPFVAIRAIVDAANRSLPAWLPQTFNSKHQIQPLHFAWQLCTHPNSLLSLIHLSRSFSAAKTTLTTVAKLAGWR